MDLKSKQKKLYAAGMFGRIQLGVKLPRTGQRHQWDLTAPHVLELWQKFQEEQDYMNSFLAYTIYLQP
jgi:hypothetical protein